MNPRNDALTQFLYAQLLERVAAAINDLPEQERLVMTLYYYEELSFAQIGTAMGVSHTYASQIYASGLVNLRARLGDPVGKWNSTVHTSARLPTNGSTSREKTIRPPNPSEDKVC